MAEPFTVERVAELHWRDIEELVAESLGAGFELLERLWRDWQSGTNRFERPGEALVAARAAGRIIATCGLNIDPYADDSSVGRVRRLYVAPRHRRRGIRRRLVTAVCAQARKEFRELRVRTGRAGADAFYEAMGFTRTNGVAHCTHALALRETAQPAGPNAHGDR